jgi:hypothetical protein
LPGADEVFRSAAGDRTPVGQIAIATAIHEMAGQLADVELRRQIQTGAAKAMAATAERMVAEQ